MGGAKGTVCPLDDNSIFVIRKHGTPRSGIQSKGSLSRQTSVNSYQSRASRLTLDEDLETLRAANIIFIRQVQQTAEKKYVIVSTSGEMMFYALETTGNRSRKADQAGAGQPFKFAVVNTQGEEVFDIDGHPGVNGVGAYVTVKRDSGILGNVAQTNKLSSCHRRIAPCYLIEAPDGRTVQKILRQDSWKNMFLGCLSVNDFNVYSPDGTICKAKISRQTKAISLEEYSEADTYALSFHTTDFDAKLKTILIAAILMLDFQFLERRAKRNWKSLSLRLLLCAIFIGLLIFGIVLVIQNSIEFQKERSTRHPGQLPSV